MGKYSVLSEIREIIETAITKNKQIIIYPYGNIGMQVEEVLTKCYAYENYIVADEKLCGFNKRIKSLSMIPKDGNRILILSSLNLRIYEELLTAVEKWGRVC